jgi:hypothetical protein
MTSERYRHYRRALESIDAMSVAGAPAEALGTLRQMAEDLLLTRDAETEAAEQLADEASVILLNLTCFRAVPRNLADSAWTDLQFAGPEVLHRILEDAGIAEPPLGSFS